MNKSYDPFAADCWSLGVLIYVMLFGFPPFYDEDENGVFDKIKQGFEPIVKDGYGAFFPADIPISEDAMDLINKLLCANPSQRITADQCLRHPWCTNDDDNLQMKIRKQMKMKIICQMNCRMMMGMHMRTLNFVVHHFFLILKWKLQIRI